MGLPKTLLKRTPLVVVSIGLALALVIILCLVLISSTRSKSKVQNASATLAAKTTAPSKQPEPTAGFPVRLKIPEINVDAALDYVGLTPQGALGVPKVPPTPLGTTGGRAPANKGTQSLMDTTAGKITYQQYLIICMNCKTGTTYTLWTTKGRLLLL